MSSCSGFEERIHECALDLGRKMGVPDYTRIGDHSWVRMDVDVTIFDNSDTKKEGSAHSFTAGTTEFIDQSLDYARQLVDAPFLLVADGGFDSADLLRLLDKRANTGFIVKHNLRKETEAQWLQPSKQYGRQGRCKPLPPEIE